MIILRPAPPPWTAELECKKCKALLKVERDDLVKRLDSGGWNPHPGWFEFTCISCSSVQRLPANIEPK